MMNRGVFLFFFLALFTTQAVGAEDFTGRAMRVLPAGANRVPPVVFSDAEGELVIAEATLLRLLEDSYFIFLDEYPGDRIASLQIGISLKECVFEEREWEGKNLRTLVSASEIDLGCGKGFRSVRDLDPGPPDPDYHHRYVEVPRCWEQPDLGTFSLYYELDSTFDPARPTVMVPSDPQQSSSWVGQADRMKRSLGIDANVVTFEYRGLFASEIPGLFGREGIDWLTAYRMLHSDNAVEDMEAIRRDLLGEEGRMHLVGGSGLAMMGLMYLNKYHQHVDRAFLMGLYHDAEAGSLAVDAFFDSFLNDHGLSEKFVAARRRVDPPQLYHLLQRLLYSNQERARELVETVSAGDLSVYQEESRKHGKVDYFIRSVQRYWPQTAVFMFLTNVPSEAYPDGGINAPFLAMGKPLSVLAENGQISGQPMHIQGLEEVSSDVLLVAGTQDQVCPVELMEALHADMPRARFLLMKGYHCLVDQPEQRALVMNAFLRHGGDSPELRQLLSSKQLSDHFVELRNATVVESNQP